MKLMQNKESVTQGNQMKISFKNSVAVCLLLVGFGFAQKTIVKDTTLLLQKFHYQIFFYLIINLCLLK